MQTAQALFPILYTEIGVLFSPEYAVRGYQPLGARGSSPISRSPRFSSLTIE
jgi:hypothetical protein